ncbi:MAG: YkvA family protein [Polyangiales bacterium]
MRVTFDLSDDDLKYFKRALKEVRVRAKHMTEDEVVKAARALLDQMLCVSAPAFVCERMSKLSDLIAMLEDSEWALTGRDRERVVRSLTYFAEPDDIIPDKVPVLGFLDDAIMVELVVGELEHELSAYADFCGFRKTREERFGPDEDPATREEWISARRQSLHARMRRRRSRRKPRGGSGGRSPIALW